MGELGEAGVVGEQVAAGGVAAGKDHCVREAEMAVAKLSGVRGGVGVQWLDGDAHRGVQHVDAERTHLHTDSAASYVKIAGDFAGHSTVDHFGGEYVRNGVTTNQAETYFSQLKRSIDGTHHHVSRDQLGRYLAEFDFRYTTCKVSDAERMRMLGGKLGGKRLTYRPAS